MHRNLGTDVRSHPDAVSIVDFLTKAWSDATASPLPPSYFQAHNLEDCRARRVEGARARYCARHKRSGHRWRSFDTAELSLNFGLWFSAYFIRCPHGFWTIDPDQPSASTGASRLVNGLVVPRPSFVGGLQRLAEGFIELTKGHECFKDAPRVLAGMAGFPAPEHVATVDSAGKRERLYSSPRGQAAAHYLLEQPAGAFARPRYNYTSAAYAKEYTSVTITPPQPWASIPVPAPAPAPAPAAPAPAPAPAPTDEPKPKALPRRRRFVVGTALTPERADAVMKAMRTIPNDSPKH